MHLPKPQGKAYAIARDTVRQIWKGQLLQAASSLSYTTILSIIPLLAVSFAIFQAFGGLDKLYDSIRPIIVSNLAEGVSDDVITRIENFIDNAHTSTIGLGGFIGLVFTSMSMLNNSEKAINRAWDIPLRRKLVYRFSTYWALITLGPLALAVAIGVATSSDLPLTRFLPSGTGMFVITVGLFFLTYKFVPHTRVKWQFALISATLAACSWNLARLGFVLYTHKVVTYSRLYGSLGAVPILLLWIYIVWLVVLSGAALTAALQRNLAPEAEAPPTGERLKRANSPSG